jgi:hypothetical protein
MNYRLSPAPVTPIGNPIGAPFLTPFSVAIITLFTVVFLNAPIASAGEGLFSRVYTTETVPAGHFELEQTIRNRDGRAYGSYSAFDSRSEFEYGFTDFFQGAFYVSTGYISAQGAPDDDEPDGATAMGFTRSGWFVESLSAEFIYRVLSPIKDPIGLAFYYEPGLDFNDLHNGKPYDLTFENEYRVLIQKNFLDDQLILAYNLVLETEFIRFKGDPTWKGELDWNNEIGLTYRFVPNWFAGLEARNHNEVSNFEAHDHSVYWAGPAVHYANERFWATLGVLRQVYGDPSGIGPDGLNIGDNHLFLRSHELWETTLKAAVTF